MIATRMSDTRRAALLSLMASASWAAQTQEPEPTPPSRVPVPDLGDTDEDKRLPNGKLMKNEIAKQDHREALKDVESLIETAEALRDELKKAGDYVVPLSSVKKTEQIEKLAKKIRGRLQS